MPPLKNIKHEKFARAVLEKPSFTQAYKEVYDPDNTRFKNPMSAKDNASRLIAKDSVKNRIAEILDSKNMGLNRFIQKHSDLLEAKSEDVQFRSMRLGYELHGLLREDSEKEVSKEINIQINVMGNTSEADPTTT